MANQIRDIPSQVSKLYLITRDDLSPAFQSVQSAHALTDAILKYPKDALEWHRKSNTLVMLSVKNEAALIEIEEDLKNMNVNFVSFREPDIGEELTAIAVLPSEEAKKYCKRFKLALQSKDMGISSKSGHQSDSGNGGERPSMPANAPVTQLARVGGPNPLYVGSNPAGSAKKRNYLSKEILKEYGF